ncbi:MAG: YebC/PmpR family DNA-binding transcriptional regulator [Opitutales bacterium]|nr:YebC/PmpR family DNA-binding transcriptional regulator [Opitutales bacterium]MBQ2722731.1 YebC/PmpR family DNA-binding transcriptional regulator [Opitutales bacterium]
MSGHSKWATTKRHKAAVDAKRGKIFSAISKDLTLAAKDGGGDPSTNARLRMLLQKAKAANMPADNVDRAIKKGTGELPGVVYEQLIYEGYGPGGIGIIVEVTTDNKNRAASDVRSTFTKNGGNLATPGALQFNFTKQGQFIISAEKASEDALMEVVLDAGAEDIRNNGDHFEVLCPISAFNAVGEALEKAGIETEDSELAWIPNSETVITDPEIAKKIVKLTDALDDLEDVQSVYSNEDLDGSLTD